MEQWLPVVGWEGHYAVSSLGRVRSVERRARTARGDRRVRERILRPKLVGPGYPMVHLHRPGESSTRTVHVLVARAFLGPCPEGMEVCHDDGDHGNPAADNLRYDTHGANQLDVTRHGRNAMHNRTHCPLRHELVEPNLVPSRLPHRICLSCNRGRATVRRAARQGVALDLQTESDRHHRALTALPRSADHTDGASRR